MYIEVTSYHYTTSTMSSMKKTGNIKDVEKNYPYTQLLRRLIGTATVENSS